MNWLKRLFGGAYIFPPMDLPRIYNMEDRVYFDGKKCRVIAVATDEWTLMCDEREYVVQRLWLRCDKSQEVIHVRNSDLNLKPIITGSAT